MKNINAIRVIAFMLVLLMMCSAVACAQTGDGSDTTPATADTTTAAPSGGDATDDPSVTTEPAETELTPDLPEVSYKDKTIKFLEHG